MTDQEIIAVVQAKIDGKRIQRRQRVRAGKSPWRPSDPCHRWNFDSHVYRVKPELLEGWVNKYETGHCGVIYPSRSEAVGMAGMRDVCRTVKVREVPEDE